MRRLLIGGGIIPALVAIAAAQGRPQAGRTVSGPAAPTEDVETLQLRPNVHMIAGAGANVTVQVGDDGVVVVDSGSSGGSSAVLAAIKKITDAPIRYIINTGADADHVGGNETISKAGVTILGTRVTGLPNSSSFNGGSGPGPASILAMEQVLARMSAPTGQAAPFPVAGWPTETFPVGQKNMYLNGEGIEVVHQPAAHSDGDAFVFFRRSDVVAVGDVLDTTHFPTINVAQGGSIQGEIDALNRLVNLAIASVPIITRDEGTLVIPAHGHVCDQFDVVGYRDMVTIVRDRVRELKASGKTLDQIKAAAPAKGYAARYGSGTGPGSTNGFIEAIVRSLTQVKS